VLLARVVIMLCMKKLAIEQIEEIIRLYQDGITPTQLSQKFGIANNSIFGRKNGHRKES
jgi:hypothetical protein